MLLPAVDMWVEFELNDEHFEAEKRLRAKVVRPTDRPTGRKLSGRDATFKIITHHPKARKKRPSLASIASVPWRQSRDSLPSLLAAFAGSFHPWVLTSSAVLSWAVLSWAASLLRYCLLRIAPARWQLPPFLRAAIKSSSKSRTSFGLMCLDNNSRVVVNISSTLRR